MNEDLKQQFLAATDTEKLAMLLAFAFHLTILIRGEHLELTGNSTDFNETLHRIVSQALAIACKSAEKYPDDVFIDMLVAGAVHRGIGRILERAFFEAKTSIKESFE